MPLEYYERTTQEQTIERWARGCTGIKKIWQKKVRNEMAWPAIKSIKTTYHCNRRYDMVFQAMTYFARTASNRIMYW
jgi:hypothetical protein